MLRGAAIVFVAILKHFVLKDKLTGFMWVGVGLNVVAILLVGATATSGDGGPDKNPLVGVGLILAGAFVQSLQYARRADRFPRKLAAAPRRAVDTSRGDVDVPWTRVAAATWTCRGDESRRRGRTNETAPQVRV